MAREEIRQDLTPKPAENFLSELISIDPTTRTRTTRQRTYHHVLFAFSDTTLELITDRLSYELVQGAEGVREELKFIKWGADAYYGPKTDGRLKGQ